MGSSIAPESVRDELPGRFVLAFQHLAKEPFSSPLVSSLRHQDVENIPVLIHRLPEIQLLPLDLHEQLIHMPDVALSPLLLSELSSILRSELPTPETDRFVRDNDATLGQQILHVSKAECEAVVEPNGVADDFGWETMASIQ